MSQDPKFLALSVQHSGTHFLGATLTYLTDTGSLSRWPETANRPRLPIGFEMRHLYGRHRLGVHRWPDHAQESWMRKWWPTGLPIVVSVRDPEKSFATVGRRSQKKYNKHDHAAALAVQEFLLGLDRVHGFNVDTDDRLAELQSLAEFLPYDIEESKVVRWARAWPTFNAHSADGGAVHEGWEKRALAGTLA